MPKVMADYLPTKTADYTSTTLSITPQNTLEERGVKKQKKHEFDDGSISVVNLSVADFFTVTLQWDIVSNEDAGTIMDFWQDVGKANGSEQTFYWEHPTDGNTYVVRFMSPLSRTRQVKFGGQYQQINQVTLRVEGVE